VRRALAALAIVASGLVLVARPAAADGDLTYEAHAAYALDAAAHVVHVAIDLTLTNTKPDQHTANGVIEYYYPKVDVPVVAEATNIVATKDDGTGLAVTPNAVDDLVTDETVTLKPAIYYRQTQHVHVTYDLPSLPPRSTGVTRINDAFVSFTAFLLGDPGLTTVEVRLPQGLKVEVIGSDMTKATDGTTVVYSSGAIADPANWQASFVGRDDSKLLESTVKVLDHDFQIQAWPDDQPWADFVSDRVTKGLPALQKLIDQPLPGDVQKVKVTETVSPYLYGYAGWYLPTEDTLEIGDALDPELVLHELSHMWFNSRLFSDRWVDEGMAEEYATRTLAALGDTLQGPAAVDPAAPGALRLNSWSSPNLKDEISQDQETFGYNAAWFVMRSLSDELGMDGLAKVIDAATQHRITYVGNPAAETLRGPTNWQRLLDLLDNTAGSTQADALFQTYVVAVGQADDLPARTAARTAYDALVAAGDGWSAPLEVRDDMSRWRFPAATTEMATATKVLDERHAIDARLEPAGLEAPAALHRDYERSADVDKLLTEAKADDRAAKVMVAAHVARDHATGFWSSIGLAGARVDTKLEAADGAYDRGRTADAVTDARAVARLAAHAATAGKERAGAGGLASLILVGVSVPLRRVHRRRRTRTADAKPAAETSEVAVVPGDDVDGHEHDPPPP
jgi:hypothetical protein